MKEEDKQIQNEEYNEYVKQVTPTNNLFWKYGKSIYRRRRYLCHRSGDLKRSYEPVWT